MSFDFDAAVSAPFRMQPGLRRLAPGARHLTPAAPGSRHMREKLAVLSAFPSQALLARPGFDARAALSALAAQAAAEHPGSLQWDNRQALAPALGVAVEAASGEVQELSAGRFGLGDELGRCLRQLPAPWRMAGLLSLAFEEDFAIVDAVDASIPWLAVCLPSHWAPEEKVGLHFAAVHAPVADNALLLKASEALARTVSGPERWERFVWNITDHPRLHAHPHRVDPQRWLHTEIADAWWRTERQTFIPLSGTAAGTPQAVFTIQVQLTRLAQAIDSPARAARLHAAVESMSPAVLAYRSLAGVREPLLRWLSARA
jgi:dimethylamine monooxygenase subunit A